jgi:Tfp pilus assembly protein PilO
MQDNVKKSLKVVHYTGMGVMTLLLAGTVAFGMLPMRQHTRDDIRASQDLKAAVNRLEQLNLANAVAMRDMQESRSLLQEAEKQIASGPPDSVFNKELTEVAKAAGIRIDNMPPVGASKDAGAYKSVQVTVVGTGDWNNCYKFLAGLRSMNRIVRLDSVVMDRQDKDGRAQATDRVTCQLTVRFSTFYMER